ncbi:dipeptide/oligopeptide/nickel ABC transporter permease/ATP-binding protein [Brachybacterium sacelli]|uniref:Peptide/nickel transport system ATP-binding protein n=1 Tax=Brachybacterium sacelli TaxID=173364 RepID=A0ABS4WZ97_9MICO|nr:dipeptide/oligopeptide/nickel ABC transporter permease/ATP-binding protein [Brachybacterium sacelli]MBP2381293.1 peptide/nickel transport system ATP-binding protein [Brachybacterium sacelli]
MSRLLSTWRTLPLTSRLGLAVVVVLCAVAILAPWLAPYDPSERVARPFAHPSLDHPLGADDAGHDLLSVLILGARPSLLVGGIAAVVATAVGSTVGLTAGYLRGVVDTVLMRVVDVVLSLPVVPLTLVIGVLAGPGLPTQIVVISLALWAPMARELRAQVLSVRERDHILALRAVGARHGYVLIRHVVPTVAVLVVPQLVLAVKSAVLLEATLAFLGLGDVSSMSWGMMLSVANSRNAFLTDAWLWWVVPPGAMIALTVLAVALASGAVERVAAGSGAARRERRTSGPRGRARLDASGRAAPSGTGEFTAEIPPEGAVTRSASPIESVRSTERGPSTELHAGASAPALLHLEGLTLRYGDGDEVGGGCREVGLELLRGEVLGLVGGSGSGKSTVASAVVGLMPAAARLQGGRILFDGIDLLELGPRERRHLLGSRIGLVPQEAQSALNPVHRVGEQIVEALLVHERLPHESARERARELLGLVGLPAERFRAYPHQLSGGQRQRVVLAIALACGPDLVVADEPTSGLDVLVQQEILELLRDLRDRLGLTMLLVTHDLPVVMQVADRLAVMHDGQVVEQGATSAVLAAPQHPCTRRLLDSLPELPDLEGASR